LTEKRVSTPVVAGLQVDAGQPETRCVDLGRRRQLGRVLPEAFEGLLAGALDDPIDEAGAPVVALLAELQDIDRRMVELELEFTLARRRKNRKAELTVSSGKKGRGFKLARRKGTR